MEKIEILNARDAEFAYFSACARKIGGSKIELWDRKKVEKKILQLFSVGPN